MSLRMESLGRKVLWLFAKGIGLAQSSSGFRKRSIGGDKKVDHFGGPMGATGLVTFWNKNRRGLGCAGTSGRIGGIIFLFSWTSPIGFTLDFDNDRAFNEAVQKSHGQWRIGKIVGPSVEVNVGEQSGGTALVASDDD